MRAGQQNLVLTGHSRYILNAPWAIYLSRIFLMLRYHVKVTVTLSVFMCVQTCLQMSTFICFYYTIKKAAQLLYICPYSPFSESSPPYSHNHAWRPKAGRGSDISERRPFGVARMQSIIQAGYGVVHCIRANVNMIPYPMCNSSYVVIPFGSQYYKGKGTVWNGLRQQLFCCSHWSQYSKPDMLVCQIRHTCCILRYQGLRLYSGVIYYTNRKKGFCM